MEGKEKWLSHQCGKPQLALIMNKTYFLWTFLQLWYPIKDYLKTLDCCCCCCCCSWTPRFPPESRSNCFSQDQKLGGQHEKKRRWFDFDWAACASKAAAELRFQELQTSANARECNDPTWSFCLLSSNFKPSTDRLCCILISSDW